MPNGNQEEIRVFEPTIAQQVFTISSGIAGGLAGFVLAKRLADAKSVPQAQIIGAALLSAAATFGAAFIVKPND